MKDSIQVETYNIVNFYNQLRKSEILNNEALNIEAITFYADHLYLFNRSRNIIIQVDSNNLIAYFKGQSPYPTPITTLFHLPEINGIESGFSGTVFFFRQHFHYIYFFCREYTKRI